MIICLWWGGKVGSNVNKQLTFSVGSWQLQYPAERDRCHRPQRSQFFRDHYSMYYFLEFHLWWFWLGEAEQWWISGRCDMVNWGLFESGFYFRRRKSSGCPLSRFSPAVCSMDVDTWLVATGPKHIIGSLKYEQIWKEKNRIQVNPRTSTCSISDFQIPAGTPISPPLQRWKIDFPSLSMTLGLGFKSSPPPQRKWCGYLCAKFLLFLERRKISSSTTVERDRLPEISYVTTYQYHSSSGVVKCRKIYSWWWMMAVLLKASESIKSACQPG